MISRNNLRKNVFASIALQLARLSTCQFTHVGCVIVNPKTQSIVSEGYNGTSSGQDHCTTHTFSHRDDHLVFATQHEIHAEINAMKKVNSLDISGFHLYTTVSPCLACATEALNRGIGKILYITPYHRDPTEHFSDRIEYEHLKNYDNF